MSFVYKHEKGCIISHSKYINNIYTNVQRPNESSLCSYAMQDDLFEIRNPFKKIYQVPNQTFETNSQCRKRKHRKHVELDSEAKLVKDISEAIVESAKSNKILIDGNTLLNGNDNDKARQMAEHCSNASFCLRNYGNGGNNSSIALYQSLKICDVLLPANCRFLCGDVRETLVTLLGETFDLIVLDPPWWNKYIRRSKAKNPQSSYEMLYNSDLADLPIGSLLSNNGVVVVWCTNSAAHEKDVKELMFHKWNVSYAATWYWVKITKCGLPVCNFTESTGKKPYERIIIGIGKNESNNMATQIKFPEGYTILSVPSALHSHKPPLNDVLSEYLSMKQTKCLEVFARYLLPNVTSVGLEPLRWQHSELYRKIS